MRHWQSKLRRLHQHLRGWAKNVVGRIKNEKRAIG
jgi:hypothetical protein